MRNIAVAAGAPHCSGCGQEVEYLRKVGSFSPEEIDAYSRFYGVLDEEFETLEELGRRLGRTAEEAGELITDIADWLTANSPFRSLPRRCWVCGHGQTLEDFAHFKEPVS